jgi:hypothetical protein
MAVTIKKSSAKGHFPKAKRLIQALITAKI